MSQTPKYLRQQTLERACRAICQSRKFETGEGTCAPKCMDQLGCARDNCKHVVEIHVGLARAIINAIHGQADVQDDPEWRKRVALSMSIEINCILEGWKDRDEDLDDLSPLEIALRISARIQCVAQTYV